MGSGVMIYIPSFVKIGSGIQKFIHSTQHGDFISLFLYFQSKASRLKYISRKTEDSELIVSKAFPEIYRGIRWIEPLQFAASHVS
jgi:hypothetical protein